LKEDEFNIENTEDIQNINETDDVEDRNPEAKKGPEPIENDSDSMLYPTLELMIV
jgi:hypothetical protein